MRSNSHPAVEKVIAALAERGVDAEVRWLDGAATTAQAAADALGVEVGQIANSLIFTLDGEPILVLTSGDHRVDTDWLGERLGGSLGRASKEMVKGATGQVIGGVAPVGHPASLPTYVDTALARYERVWAAAGHAKTVFPITYQQLLRVTAGIETAVEETATAETAARQTAEQSR